MSLLKICFFQNYTKEIRTVWSGGQRTNIPEFFFVPITIFNEATHLLFLKYKNHL
ncbi:Uncharacterised protein [Enterobacter hormaechei]|nr:Uncharacterised protein [Enterobacter hormaechei]SAG12152.1 Uncharacterised protein [Enterobacter hormaechei]VAM08737.1 Uncharacterised protein [Enterobacter hormaechei]